MPTLFISICEKLGIIVKKEVKDINFFSVNEEGYPNFIGIEDISNIVPQVKDFSEMNCIGVLGKEDSFPSSL